MFKIYSIRLLSTRLYSVLSLLHFADSAFIPDVLKYRYFFHMNGNGHVELDPLIKYQLYDTVYIIHTA